jgi:hypothetical protein
MSLARKCCADSVRSAVVCEIVRLIKVSVVLASRPSRLPERRWIQKETACRANPRRLANPWLEGYSALNRRSRRSAASIGGASEDSRKNAIFPSRARSKMPSS